VHAPDLKTVAARRRVVDRACELMLSRSVQPPSILEICDRIGASPRKLSCCFRDVMGVSPARHLLAMRLNNKLRVDSERWSRRGV
jgi:AraC family ethanolamine operon transcriptional activator